MAKEVRESEVKNRLKRDYFDSYDWTRVVGDIDLTVCAQPVLGEPQTTFLWAETKKGSRDYYESLIQLILTIGKARTYESELPPYFLGAADAQGMAFVPYSDVMHIFSKTDFNWNVTPSDHSTKEFKELYSLLKDELARSVVFFKYAFDSETMKKWIRKNFKEGRKASAKMPVNKNNFTFVYYDWVKTVKPTISFDWDRYAKLGVLDCDFYLADLMSVGDISIHDSLKVVLEKTKYKLKREIEGDELFSEFSFTDKMIAYHQFWNRYERPPKLVYQKYILDRRDLLVPQNIREVKGSYYTPEIWVRKAQEYIEKVLGENWQEEYYVWDCAAGSGNLLRGLTNKYNIFASTLDDADVKIMHQAIDEGRLNLVKNNVFQFDFLNDDFDKCPDALQKILSDEEKRKRLVIFINAPYKEATNGRTSAGTGKNNTGATKGSKVWEKYGPQIGAAINELFAQFCFRIMQEIPGCVLAEFSTLKILQAPNFSEFRKKMNSRLISLFVVPGDTFDNVKGSFPIGFHIFKTGEKDAEPFESITADVYTYNAREKVAASEGKKTVACYDNQRLINTWIGPLLRQQSPQVGWIKVQGNDFQNCNYINVYSEKPVSHNVVVVVVVGLLAAVTYHAVRKIPVQTWLNDRDQFLAPRPSWAEDIAFQSDCLVWSIFNNYTKQLDGICHWIPFYEEEVKSPSPFNSRFMADFLHGKVKREAKVDVTGDIFAETRAREAAQIVPIDALSPEAKAVLDAGRKLWKYYLAQPNVNPNASYYDIRCYFQDKATDKQGKERLLPSSGDYKYMQLWGDVKEAIKALEKVIEPKIYEHGFLLK